MEETSLILSKVQDNLQKLVEVIEKKKKLEFSDELKDIINSMKSDSRDIEQMVGKGKLQIDSKLQDELLQAIETIKKSPLFQQDVSKMQVVFQQILAMLTKNIKNIPYKVVKVNLPIK